MYIGYSRVGLHIMWGIDFVSGLPINNLPTSYIGSWWFNQYEELSWSEAIQACRDEVRKIEHVHVEETAPYNC